MVVFQNFEGKTTTLNFWNKKLEGKMLIFYTENKQTGQLIFSFFVTLTKNEKWNELDKSSNIFLPVFSLIWFWILLRNVFSLKWC